VFQVLACSVRFITCRHRAGGRSRSERRLLPSMRVRIYVPRCILHACQDCKNCYPNCGALLTRAANARSCRTLREGHIVMNSPVCKLIARCVFVEEAREMTANRPYTSCLLKKQNESVVRFLHCLCTPLANQTCLHTIWLRRPVAMP
jgi:hypothetical protein